MTNSSRWVRSKPTSLKPQAKAKTRRRKNRSISTRNKRNKQLNKLTIVQVVMTQSLARKRRRTIKAPKRPNVVEIARKTNRLKKNRRRPRLKRPLLPRLL
jgi:hypothetical protein